VSPHAHSAALEEVVLLPPVPLVLLRQLEAEGGRGEDAGPARARPRALVGDAEDAAGRDAAHDGVGQVVLTAEVGERAGGGGVGGGGARQGDGDDAAPVDRLPDASRLNSQRAVGRPRPGTKN